MASLDRRFYMVEVDSSVAPLPSLQAIVCLAALASQLAERAERGMLGALLAALLTLMPDMLASPALHRDSSRESTTGYTVAACGEIDLVSATRRQRISLDGGSDAS
ncbi:hypothetical protein PT974_04976 [Cladobotryum mycophilum]|uniref:Uncharacterized protein n=1 Tax=Cladobotryum mycophilum TaxID=491253 RepID=A0ABR0SQW7_9HYPO